ncbi:OTU domain-containing protein, partial [Saccharopolyspora sp. NPDC050389]|uniref:OTU domain-containing protein n=1 Tax=Saccharopolyspora sp. NPDC050389 TaxID=3155516 RepID=UPI0033CBE4A9
MVPEGVRKRIVEWRPQPGGARKLREFLLGLRWDDGQQRDRQLPLDQDKSGRFFSAVTQELVRDWVLRLHGQMSIRKVAELSGGLVSQATVSRCWQVMATPPLVVPEGVRKRIVEWRPQPGGARKLREFLLGLRWDDGQQRDRQLPLDQDKSGRFFSAVTQELVRDWVLQLHGQHGSMGLREVVELSGGLVSESTVSRLWKKERAGRKPHVSSGSGRHTLEPPRKRVRTDSVGPEGDDAGMDDAALVVPGGGRNEDISRLTQLAYASSGLWGTPEQRATARGWGLEIRDVGADGDCFYRSVLDSVPEGVWGARLDQFGYERSVEGLRDALADNYLQRFVASTDAERASLQIVADDIRAPRSWSNVGGDVAPQLVADLLGVNIVVIVPDGRLSTQGVEQYGTRETYCIVYNGTDHYMATRRLEDTHAAGGSRDLVAPQPVSGHAGLGEGGVSDVAVTDPNAVSGAGSDTRSDAPDPVFQWIPEGGLGEADSGAVLGSERAIPEHSVVDPGAVDSGLTDFDLTERYLIGLDLPGFDLAGVDLSNVGEQAAGWWPDFAEGAGGWFAFDQSITDMEVVPSGSRARTGDHANTGEHAAVGWGGSLVVSEGVRERITLWRPQPGWPQTLREFLLDVELDGGQRLPLGKDKKGRFACPVTEGLVKAWVQGLRWQTNEADGFAHTLETVAALSGGLAGSGTVWKWWGKVVPPVVPEEVRKRITEWRPQTGHGPQTLREFLLDVELEGGQRLPLARDKNGRFGCPVTQGLVKAWVQGLRWQTNEADGFAHTLETVAALSGGLTGSGTVWKWWGKVAPPVVPEEVRKRIIEWRPQPGGPQTLREFLLDVELDGGQRLPLGKDKKGHFACPVTEGLVKAWAQGRGPSGADAVDALTGGSVSGVVGVRPGEEVGDDDSLFAGPVPRAAAVAQAGLPADLREGIFNTFDVDETQLHPMDVERVVEYGRQLGEVIAGLVAGSGPEAELPDIRITVRANVKGDRRPKPPRGSLPGALQPTVEERTRGCIRGLLDQGMKHRPSHGEGEADGDGGRGVNEELAAALERLPVTWSWASLTRKRGEDPDFPLEPNFEILSVGGLSGRTADYYRSARRLTFNGNRLSAADEQRLFWRLEGFVGRFVASPHDARPTLNVEILQNSQDREDREEWVKELRDRALNEVYEGLRPRYGLLSLAEL